MSAEAELGTRFSGKTCAYCGEEGISSTGDHVIPRQFFPERVRSNLPQVAACFACNNAKSVDEHYLATVLPFGGTHPVASAILERDVPRRLEKNQKLHAALAAGRTRVHLRDNGVIAGTLALPIEFDRIVRFARFAIRGLHAHHWGPIPKGMWVGAGMLAPVGAEFHQTLMNMRGIRVREELGDGLFSYAAVRSLEAPYVSAWSLRLFGGVLLAGDPAMPEHGTRDLYGLVATEPFSELFPD